VLMDSDTPQLDTPAAELRLKGGIAAAGIQAQDAQLLVACQTTSVVGKLGSFLGGGQVSKGGLLAWEASFGIGSDFAPTLDAPGKHSYSCIAACDNSVVLGDVSGRIHFGIVDGAVFRCHCFVHMHQKQVTGVGIRAIQSPAAPYRIVSVSLDGSLKACIVCPSPLFLFT
jgi:hypothetical protein